MRTVTETEDFTRDALKIWTEAEYDDFVEWIAKNPLAGEVIPKAGGARKVRWSVSGSGKSGGVRVIYFNLTAQGHVLLIAIYAKAKRENMPAKEIRDRSKE